MAEAIDSSLFFFLSLRDGCNSTKSEFSESYTDGIGSLGSRNITRARDIQEDTSPVGIERIASCTFVHTKGVIAYPGGSGEGATSTGTRRGKSRIS